MSWTLLQPRHSAARAITLRSERQGNGSYRAVLVVRAALLGESLAWLAPKAKVSALLGSDEHAGMLRLEPGGPLLLREDRGVGRLMLPLPGEVVHGETCEPIWEEEEGAVVLALPLWCGVEPAEPVDLLGSAETVSMAEASPDPDPEPEPVLAVSPPSPTAAGASIEEVWTAERLAYVAAHAWDPVRDIQDALLDMEGPYIALGALKEKVAEALAKTPAPAASASALAEHADYATIYQWAAARGLASSRGGMDLEKVNKKRRDLGLVPFEMVPRAGRAA